MSLRKMFDVFYWDMRPFYMIFFFSWLEWFSPKSLSFFVRFGFLFLRGNWLDVPHCSDLSKLNCYVTCGKLVNIWEQVRRKSKLIFFQLYSELRDYPFTRFQFPSLIWRQRFIMFQKQSRSLNVFVQVGEREEGSISISLQTIIYRFELKLLWQKLKPRWVYILSSCILTPPVARHPVSCFANTQQEMVNEIKMPKMRRNCLSLKTVRSLLRTM